MKKEQGAADKFMSSEEAKQLVCAGCILFECELVFVCVLHSLRSVVDAVDARKLYYCTCDAQANCNKRENQLEQRGNTNTSTTLLVSVCPTDKCAAAEADEGARQSHMYDPR